MCGVCVSARVSERERKEGKRYEPFLQEGQLNALFKLVMQRLVLNRLVHVCIVSAHRHTHTVLLI